MVARAPPATDALTAELHARLEEGLRLCRSGAYAQAEQLYRELTLARPEAPDAWNMLAVVLYERGKLEPAAEAAAHATGLRPTIAPYWLVRGNIELAQRHHHEAQQSFSRAIGLDPSFAEAHFRLGVSYHAESRPDLALSAYRETLQFAPDVAEVHWRIAEALVALGKVDEAMRAYGQVFARDPEARLDRRGCFDVLSRQNFDALPAFWHAELQRFFENPQVDTPPYVRAGIKALKTKECFRTALHNAAEGAGALTLDTSVREALGDPLLHVLLRDCLIADAQLERFLTSLRAQLLLHPAQRGEVPLEFLCALAMQCFNNEYVYFAGDAELARTDALRGEVEMGMKAAPGDSESLLRSLLLLACYRPLADVDGIERAGRYAALSPHLERLLQRSVTDARMERALRDTIEPITDTTDPVSRSVRGMYEQNPYPRWFTVDREPSFPLSEWIARELPAIAPTGVPSAPRILIAGCGTGHDAIWTACNIENSHVFAVDLSLSSLAYGRRMAEALAVRNIEFRQGDILALSCLAERFDMIASTGVLHHMREPAAGLRSLAGLLRPGGLMKLGFYSTRARAAVNAAREIIAKEQIPATEAGIRAFRQRVLASDERSALNELQYSNDFYSMSMCRDLLFHVQEHQYTLPQLGAMLLKLDLEFLGLAELPPDTLARYRSMFPGDEKMVDIASWDVYEQRYPDTFSRMFLFWCRKKA